MTVWRLAQREAVNDDEWGVMFAVLAQVEKARRYPAWSREEHVSASPRPSSSSDPPAALTRLSIRGWRARSPAATGCPCCARAAPSSISSAAAWPGSADAEQQALPILRDVLAKAAAAALGLADGAPSLDALSDMLQLDVAATGKLTTIILSRRSLRLRERSSRSARADSPPRIRRARGLWRSTLARLIWSGRG